MSKGLRKTTIYDIAEASGASPTAVSMVLNGRGKEHRIKPDTASRILRLAAEMGYSPNLKARGLRLSRSGLGGMILPHYRNRFFAGLAETFEAEVRHRGLCPIVVSTQRDPVNEMRVTEVLLAQQIEFLFITGVHDPNPLNKLCAAAGVPCINVDLPGDGAPSVISDNRGGAFALTEILVAKLEAQMRPVDDWFFFGGVSHDNSTRERIEGFRQALAKRGVSVPDDAFDCQGYSPAVAEKALGERYRRLGRLPSSLFINGITGLEGALRFESGLNAGEFARTVIGAFDWDPFAAHLPFDLTMVRQDVEAMVSASFALLDDYRPGHNPRVEIPTMMGAATAVSR
ncbi:LacI family DNA-binding transcriptional regulator [Mesorhizobium sp. LMG 17147]|uniref:LacI family DNA-binding transcriptional regulator n=1 Tax=Mesorhizobium sp. LMG 17147 TaxID=2963091 RepID=UPI00267594C5|nr:LacI family DNA-binding transcriptional regulator [Mesorhizobium sp. LMG 17147]